MADETIRRSNEDRLRWLDYYGLGRMKGASVRACVETSRGSLNAAARNEFNRALGVYSALEVTASGPSVEELVQTYGGMTVLVTRMGTLIASSIMNAITEGSGAAVGGAGVAAGTILNLAYSAIGAFAGWVESTAEWKCDDNCAGIDSYAIRRAINLSWPPGSPSYIQGQLGLAQLLHDGLVVEGLGSGPNSVGRANGVVAWVKRGARNYEYPAYLSPYGASTINEHFRLRAEDAAAWEQYLDTPLHISRGDAGTPWNAGVEGWNGGDNWYARAWKVRALLSWLGGDVNSGFCPFVSCLRFIITGRNRFVEDVIRQAETGTQVEEAKKLRLATVRSGSRWYASIYQMMKDAWEMCLAVHDHGRLWEMMRSVGVTDTVVSRFRTLDGDYAGFTQEQVAFPWMPLLGKVNFDQLRQLMPKLADEVGAELQPVVGWAVDPGMFARYREILSGGDIPSLASDMVDYVASGLSDPGASPDEGRAGETSPVTKVAVGAGAAALTILILKKLLGS